MFPQVLDFRKVTVYTVLLLASGVALVAGYFIEKELHYELSGHILTEVGIAGVVGFILALTFERLSADEFRKLANEERDAIKRDVFHYVFGHSIPPEITDEIDTQILKAVFVRKNLSMDYTLEPLGVPGEDVKYVLMTLIISYDIENLTTGPQLFPLGAHIEKAPKESLNEHVKFTSLEVKGCTKPFTHDEEYLRDIQRVNDIQLFLLFENHVTVLPDRPTSVTIKSQTVKHLEGGYDYFIFTNHTCDLDLTAFVPNRDMKVLAAAFADNVLFPTPRHNPQSGRYHWKLQRPLLAYQGVFVTWMPNSRGVQVRPANLLHSAEPAPAVAGGAARAPGGAED